MGEVAGIAPSRVVGSSIGSAVSSGVIERSGIDWSVDDGSIGEDIGGMVSPVVGWVMESVVELTGGVCATATVASARVEAARSLIMEQSLSRETEGPTVPDWNGSLPPRRTAQPASLASKPLRNLANFGGMTARQ